ncbi:tryptophan synthase subunit alpha [Gilvimarinus sp. SDUM040013]|uniref:Tryptophan synthase alpha chain n=1 Tax=Gilvimarinus gilvus TaxID=3058038 RepID=A0ABU4RXT3_9GAMM|nr:tryptophan synthase subunit alpha [Gilvimarinus sp. SDUM040013]MDO3386438.1 tryptophan synthase subunit alpha [Gilvimarinus sp. SDUM040013]MDX6849704.1 tryptophan synthase subunit alpha [Gilvimarinus sp. SDUM040013]
MSRISKTFSDLKNAGRKALVAYIVNGDPNREATLPTMHKMVAAGADIIELGVPFSDPMAEGPVIQKGHERALEHHVSLTDTMAVVAEFRKENKTTPVLLMGYANPVERMGYSVFAQKASAAGVDGLLTVDLPLEELEGLKQELASRDIDNIFLLAPTTSVERARQVAAQASGFLYYVSLKGVTGAGHLDVKAVQRKLQEFGALTDLPMCVGFGIKDAASAKAVAELADGVVIGSVLVDAMGKAQGQSPEQIAGAVGGIISDIRQALDSL